MPDNFIIRLLDMRKQFIIENDREPTELHISNTDKIELLKCMLHYSHELAKRLNNERIEDVLPQLHGLPVIYGSRETKYG